MTIELEQIFNQITTQVFNELVSANHKFMARFNSDHEGYAVIKEELEEVWEEIKKDNHQLAREEMIQVAAMAVKFVYSSMMREKGGVR